MSYKDEYEALFGDLDDCRLEIERKPREHPPGSCECCGATEGVKYEDSRTAYDTTPIDRYDLILKMDEPDPNAPVELCRDCAEDHKAYWDEMWSYVYSSCM